MPTAFGSGAWSRRRCHRVAAPIAQATAPSTVRARSSRPLASAALGSAWPALALVGLALAVYLISNPPRENDYNHFVWQAAAFLDGRLAIDYPVVEGAHVNYYLQDVMPLADQPGRGLLPFPPLPAILLLPLVMFAGLDTDATILASVLGAINVGLAWRMTMRLTDDRRASLLATVFFGFGTVHWYAAMLGTTWFLAHVVAVTFLLLSVSLALDGERQERARSVLRRLGGAAVPGGWFQPLQFMAGFLLGLAALARLPVLFGAPFLVFVGAGGSYRARALSAGLGAVIPFLLLLAYNLAASGHLFNPAYEWLYQTEYLGYLPPPGCYAAFPREVCEFLTINREYAIEDPRHIPLSALIMLLWPPIVQPGCGLELFSRSCPLVRPDAIGMSIVLTSPAYLLALPLIRAGWRRRLVMGSALAILAIALINLAHFSQGWVQFGYRFSNDFVPFALVLVTLAIAWRGVRPLVVGLVVLSVLVNAWGVYWGVMLGW
jgi:predicted anti-sigma-YlaC factor YlaD